MIFSTLMIITTSSSFTFGGVIGFFFGNRRGRNIERERNEEILDNTYDNLLFYIQNRTIEETTD